MPKIAIYRDDSYLYFFSKNEGDLDWTGSVKEVSEETIAKWEETFQQFYLMQEEIERVWRSS